MSEALGVLFEMASKPATAGSALALLHELQVHQVELDLQDEELRRSRAEIETTLRRQTQLYEHAPTAYFTVNQSTALHELNLAGVAMLGRARDQLLGRTLLSFLDPRSARDLKGMLGRLSDGVLPSASGALQLMVGDQTPRSVRAYAKRDPAGCGFLLAFVDAAELGDGEAG
jgi:PAS domain-containing protein